QIIDEMLLKNVGPDNLTIRLTLIVGDQTGTVTAEILDEESGNHTAAGNVDFNMFENIKGTCLEGAIQIQSAFFSEDYRGIGLGLASYELIAKHFLLLSDTRQTHEGSAFWKFKLAAHDKLKVNIIINPETKNPIKMTDEHQSPITYHYTKEELESVIWGLEYENDNPHPGIKASRTTRQNNIALLAVKIE
ncbi:hypothetical protein, partial [Plesiomonas shigelloides]